MKSWSLKSVVEIYVELKLRCKNFVLLFNLDHSILQLARIIERLLATVLFHSAKPLYVIQSCKCLELKQGIMTESEVLDW